MQTRTLHLSPDFSSDFLDGATTVLLRAPENTADTFLDDGPSDWRTGATRTVFEAENAVPTLVTHPNPMIGESEADERLCAARNAYTASVIAPAWFHMMSLLIRSGCSPLEATAHCECMFED